MENNDTIHLLKECDAGSKMAVASIDDTLENIKNSELIELLNKSKANHTKLGNELHSLLNEYGSEEKDPNTMAKVMSWLKTNMKMSMDRSDAVVADLMTDGCNMGIKSLYKYLNKYPDADKKATAICKNLIDIEEELLRDLRGYL